MSSYVISKRDYARLAGVIAGIGTQTSRYNELVFYKYNFEERRPYTVEDFRNEIMKLYELNFKSVAIQYGGYHSDTFEEMDQNEYKDEFEKYFIESSRLYKRANGFGTIHDVSNFKKLCFYINDFFQSISYQIEEEECEQKANTIMRWYSQQLLNLIKKLDLTSEYLTWGDFEFFEEKEAD